MTTLRAISPRALLTSMLALSLAVLAPASASLAQASAPPADERPRRVLVESDGAMRVVRIIRLTDREIVYEDALGRRRHAAVGGVAALAPPTDDEPIIAEPSDDAGAASAPLPALTTVDGQRFTGELAGTAAGDDSVVWRHPAFGPIVVPLERVASAILRSVDAPAADQQRPAQSFDTASDAQPAADELLLINGDRLSGFLLGLGDPVEIEVDGGVVAVEADRVAAAQLANPREPRSGLVVWLEDGAVAVVASLETREDGAVEVRLPGGQAAVYPLRDVRAVAFEAARLRSLAQLTPLEQAPAGDRRWTPPVRALPGANAPAGADLGLRDVMLPGPMRVVYELPAASARFVAVAEMPLENRDWGDCALVVRIDGVERFRTRINRATPTAEINVPARGERLTIAIEPGLYGPIRDVVILRRPALLLDADASADG